MPQIRIFYFFQQYIMFNKFRQKNIYFQTFQVSQNKISCMDFIQQKDQIYYFPFYRRVQIFQEEMQGQYSEKIDRITQYLQVLERDMEVNKLRKQFYEEKKMQKEYEDIQYQIDRVQRQKKLIERKNYEVKQEYLKKIKANQQVISILTDEVQASNKQLALLLKQIENIDEQCQMELKKVEKSKEQVDQIENKNLRLEREIYDQQIWINEQKHILTSLQEEKASVQLTNKQGCIYLDHQYKDYLSKNSKVQEEERIRQRYKKELDDILCQKQKLVEKSDQNFCKMKEMEKKYNQTLEEKQKFEKKARQLQNQMNSCLSNSTVTRQKIKSSFFEDKEKSQGLLQNTRVVDDLEEKLFAQKMKKEYLVKDLAILCKNIEHTQTVNSNIDQEIKIEQNNNLELNNRIKESTKNNEAAIQSFMRTIELITKLTQ